MDLVSIDALLTLAQSGPDGRWPLPSEEAILKRINTYIALREGDKDRLKTVAGWPDGKPYRVDPLPERIADAWAHYLFGEDPRVVAGAEADAELVEALIDRDLPSELERAAGLAVSEGEAWARVYVDPAVAPRPLLEWHSRANVLPLYVGPRLKAAAVITELPKRPSDDKGTVYRHMEVHAAGGLVNVLFRGRGDRLGSLIELDEHPATEELPPQWAHDLPGMLVERVPNRIRRDVRLGISDYAGILDYLLDLNEAAAIGAHNARLTARKRAIVSASALKPAPAGPVDALGPEENLGPNPPRPRFDPTEEVFVEDPLDGELGKDRTSPVTVVEYSFDAEALIAWQRHLVETAVSRVGLAAQYAGVSAGNEGYAISGTALRLRLIPTDATGRGKARYWLDALPRILATMQAVDAIDAGSGGFGRPWTAPLTPPVIERRPGLPTDGVEEAQRHASLVGAGIESKWQAVRELHPDWTEQDVNDEVERIEASAPSSTLPTFGA